MTEAEWLACENPGRLLGEVGARLSRRKLLLFGAAIVRRHPDLLAFPGARDTLDMVERFAEGQLSEDDLLEDLARLSGLLGAVPQLDPVTVLIVAEYLQRRKDRLGLRQRERRLQAELLRDIAGNPFRPCVLDPLWRKRDNGLVVRLARVAADERRQPDGTLDGTRLAILGDALEDVGCTDEQILSHLHGPGPHVRGCWVVDLLLDRR
jgi:hypothetical protein